jgi:hypothetical protein
MNESSSLIKPNFNILNNAEEEEKEEEGEVKKEVIVKIDDSYGFLIEKEEFKYTKIFIKNCCDTFTVLLSLALIVLLPFYVATLGQWVETQTDVVGILFNAYQNGTTPNMTYQGHSRSASCYTDPTSTCLGGKLVLKVN